MRIIKRVYGNTYEIFVAIVGYAGALIEEAIKFYML
jgi:hypothetical protein